MAHYEPSRLNLCCLQKPVIIASGSERVKSLLFCCFFVCLEFGHTGSQTESDSRLKHPSAIVRGQCGCTFKLNEKY